jgi:AmmeMemoRadiSam system protein B
VVVPHHLVASEDIAVGIRSLVDQNITNVLLLTPDHFQRCPTALCTADVAYQTLFGETRSSPEIVRKLLASPLVTEDADLFRREHGAYAITPFIAHYLTGVTVTPLAVTTDPSWKTRRQDLLDLVSRVVDGKTAVVVSSDFSHYLPLKSAEAEDASTSAAILENDLDAIASLKNPDQSDCPACLWLMTALAKQRGSAQPTILKHTNSATIMKEENAPETTSHFAIVWCQGQSL